MTRTLTLQGAGRSYRAYVPPGSGPVALVVVMHGYGGGAAEIEQASGWTAEARRQGFAVLYPEGVAQAFNAGLCCGTPAQAGVDDVGAVLAMVDDLARTRPVDAARLYATGFSNGGMMAYRLACETDRFAAVAPVAATQVVGCSSRQPTSILHVHGAADDVVRLDGQPGRLGVATPAVPGVIEGWRTVLRCEPATTSSTGPLTTSAARCPDGREVTLVTVDGLGHGWPARGTYEIAPTVWWFFDGHRR